MYFFSVIVTIYNGEAFLASCINSILCNPPGNYELIIIDDGSTDNTRIICDRYTEQFGHIKCVHTANKGVGNARQEGLERASGEYIIFVDGDDVWDESFRLQKMEKEIKRSPADLYVFGFILRRVGQKGFIDRPYEIKASVIEDWRDEQATFLSYFPNGLMFFCWNKVFRRKCIVDNSVISVHQHMEDFRFVLEFLKVAKTVEFLSETPYIYYKRENQSLTSSAYLGMLDGYNCCHSLFLSLFDKEYAAFIHQIMTPAYIATINRHLRFMDLHKEETTAKAVLAEISHNDLVQKSFHYYHPASFSERVTVFLMRNGYYSTLKKYRKLTQSIKSLIS